MKKILALLAVVLGVVSCQTEPEGLDVNVGGEVETTVCVSLPEATRANSALGAFENVKLADEGLTIRYILKIYQHTTANGVETWTPSNDLQVRYTQDKDETIVFPVRLVPNRDYNFVVWADLVEKTDEQGDDYYRAGDDVHYNTSDLANITLKGDWNAMDETRDAYTGFYNTKVNGTQYSSSLPINITLTRPFAKLRVITTDMVALNNLGIMPTKATVEYDVAHYGAFNALAGQPIGDSKNRNIKHENFDIKSYGENVQAGADMTLFTDYFFANQTQEPVQFELTVYDQNGTADANIIKYNNFSTEIAVQRNYLTTISGNILTDGNNVTVEVKDAFENKANWNDEPYFVNIVEVGNAADLQKAINESTEETVIVLSNDIVLGATASTLSTRSADSNSITVPEGTTSTIELNGKTIRTQWSDEAAKKHYYAIYNYGNLTIKDSGVNGAIVSRGIYNYGTMTLESGKIDACDGNGGYAVKNEPNATFVMNGGSVVTSFEDGDEPTKGYDATTIRNDAGATATFNGGVVNNISNYTFALDNAGTVTVNDGTFTSIHSTVSSYGTMTINGGSFTCNGLDGVSAHALVVWNGSNTTINGGTFDGKDNYNGFNVDAAEEGAVVNIYGGNFLDVHSGSLYGPGTINVMGGTFFDDPSARVVPGYKVARNEEGKYTVTELVLNATFAQNDWSDIVLACENNCVPDSWNVGDTKAMTIDGKGYQIRILGKNHDTYTAGGTAPLTFQIAEVYGTAPMNATQTNTTGWSGSKMRTETMAEILKVMPVKDAIKAVNKETLNGTRDGLETTSDKLFLLSEIEVNGSVYFSNNFAEGSRYAFFGYVDSQKLNATYWLRGPGKDNAIGYTQINMSGYMANGSAEYACGVVFGFCF